MLKDLIEFNNLEGIEVKKLPSTSKDYIEQDELCPECGNAMVMMSGCKCCLSCGYSPCK
jgi:hypothetical protein